MTNCMLAILMVVERAFEMYSLAPVNPGPSKFTSALVLLSYRSIHCNAWTRALLMT
ncbi:MAG: hypothetical protein QOH50_5416 [Kribbellaceae bacterium]|nr:hypothetical protein [Kribbellaceae bacterium]